MLNALAFAVFGFTATGSLHGVVTIGPLSHREHVLHHTHWDSNERVGGYDLEIYREPYNDASSQPVQKMAIPDSGRFLIKLPAGRYRVVTHHDMHAGAFTDYPTKRVRIRANHQTNIRLRIRSEVLP